MGTGRIKVIVLAMLLTFLLITPLSADGAYRPVEGYIKDLDIQQNWLVVEEYSGSIRRLNITSGTAFLIDDTPAVPEDFKAGMEVYAEVSGSNLSRIESWSTENPGYIPPGGKVRTGVVRKIDRDQIILQLATGKEETYFLSPATIVLKKGVKVSAAALYEGDAVKLYFDEAKSPIISRIHIQGDSVKIKALYRGELSYINQAERSFVLKKVKIFLNGTWRDYKDIMQIRYSRDIPVFYEGISVKLDQIKYYIGSTVYVPVREVFGREQADRIVVKSQYERTFSDKIDEINWYAQSFELKNKQNVNFDEGTIFIKNDRLVDQYALAAGSDAFVVADGTLNRSSAKVVYVYDRDINNSNIGQYHLYSGTLDTVLENRVIIKDFFLLNHNEWESFDDEKELFYDNDTFIYDLEDERQITPEEFFAGYYAVDEDSRYAESRGLKSWNFYAYTDGDRIVAILLKEDMDSLLRQRITTGTIYTVQEDPLVGWIVELKDARDWSSRNEKWMPKTTTVKVRIEQALIIKDDKMITWDELKPQDSIYCVRDDFDGVFLLVK